MIGSVNWEEIGMIVMYWDNGSGKVFEWGEKGEKIG